MLTQFRAKELFNYDPVTGLLTNKVSRCRARAGDVAGSMTKRGRLRVKVDMQDYFVHQVVWVWVTGLWAEQVDHRDLNQANNKWANLREANSSTNQANTRKQNKPGGTASKLKGVYRAKNGRWASRVSCRGKRYFLGVFLTEEAAHAAYVAKATVVFGEFARAA